MPVSCIEERLSNTLMRKRIYRILFVKFTGWFDLKNLIIKRELKRIIKKKQHVNPKVLDVGFGLGQQIHYLLNIVPKANVLGIEVSEKAITCANKYFNAQKYPNIYCMRKDILSFEGNESFDLVFAFKLLNYIKDDKAAIAKMRDALKPKGTLLILNQYSTKSPSKVVFDDIHTMLLVRNGYTMEELRDLLKDAGFSTVKCRYIYGHTGQLAWKIAIGIPVKLIKINSLFSAIIPIYLFLTAPLVLLLNYYDLKIGHVTGHSIFLTAQK